MMWSGLEVSPSVYPSKLSYLYTIPISQKTGRGACLALNQPGHIRNQIRGRKGERSGDQCSLEKRVDPLTAPCVAPGGDMDTYFHSFIFKNPFNNTGD